MNSCFRIKFSVVAAILCCVVPAFLSADQNQPNIIIIYADDLGYTDVEGYPHWTEDIPTPNCNQLIKRGAMFVDAHSASAVCTPSRYSLLTGRYSWRTWLKAWVVQEHMPLLIEEDRLTIGKMLQKAGYQTGMVGKWHLGWGRENNDYQNGKLIPGPLEVGFDSSYAVPFSHNSSKPMRVFVDDRQVVGVKPDENINDEDVLKNALRSLPDTATNLSESAVEFIRRNKDQPFFLYYPTTNVHFPVTPHKRFAGKSDRGNYGDFTVEFDWAVGEVMRTLEELNLTDNTIVIVTSDNGSIETKSNQYFRGRKCSIYEGGHRVPFIVFWPSTIEPGLVVDGAICQTDVMPTIAEILGITLPAGAAEDGVSFLPLIKGEALPNLRKPIVHHGLLGEYAIRHGKWKLIDSGDDLSDAANWNAMHQAAKGKPIRNSDGHFEDLTFGIDLTPASSKGQKGQLFDLENDPRETTDLWDQHPDVVENLLRQLGQERNSSQADSAPKK